MKLKTISEDYVLKEDILLENVLQDLVRKGIKYVHSNLEGLAKRYGIQKTTDIAGKLSEKEKEYEQLVQSAKAPELKRADRIANNILSTILGKTASLAKSAAQKAGEETLGHLERSFFTPDNLAALVILFLVGMIPGAAALGSFWAGGMSALVAALLITKVRDLFFAAEG